MDQLIKEPVLAPWIQRLGRKRTQDLLSRGLGDYRKALQIDPSQALEGGALIEWLITHMEKTNRSKLCRVINATGVVVHTNLGRAPIAESALDALREHAGRYASLEYDLSTGKRGKRDDLVTDLLTELTGAEGALVVNNNAAAVYFVLKAFAEGKKVVLSRGELVEIGGSFRIPDVMRLAGAQLEEVGTTNKTKIEDYAQAIDEDVALLMKVHPSNYRIEGFTHQATAEEVAALSKAKGLLYVDDLGSGNLLDEHEEDLVVSRLKAGADLVTFSGDKLLGGSQAGIILGRKDLIEKLSTHPLYRALRVDKTTFSILETTLRLYLAGRESEVPIHRMAKKSTEALKVLAEKVVAEVDHPALFHGPMLSTMGGGSLPGQSLASYGLLLDEKSCDVTSFEKTLRTCHPPVIGRISDGRLHLDLRTVFDDEIPLLIKSLQRVLSGGEGR